MKKHIMKISILSLFLCFVLVISSCNQESKDVNPLDSLHIVKFETNGGTEIESQSVETGKKVVKPTDPLREGFVFTGWFSDEKCTNLYDFESSVESSFTLYAKWTEQYTVFFNANGGFLSGAETQRVICGEKLTKPIDPNRENYIFSGWYTDKECENRYDFDSPVENSFTLYAKWIGGDGVIIICTDELSTFDYSILQEGDVILIFGNAESQLYSIWNSLKTILQSLDVHVNLDLRAIEGFSTVRDYAFEDCKSLISVKLPDSVIAIGNNAFDNCTSLTDVTIPDSVITIGDYAFYNCTSLTTVTIPNSVMTIGDNAFANCTSLTNIELPNSVTAIGKFAFSSCGLTSVKLSESLTILANCSFIGCGNLTSVKIPNSVTTIEQGVFNGCGNLTSVDIPNSVTTIGLHAFSYCKSLRSIELPDSVTLIGNNAFSNCFSLTTVSIPNSVTTIGNGAFDACLGLTSVEISASVTTMCEGIFVSCVKLKNIQVDDMNPFYKSINGVLFSKDGTKLICYPAAKTDYSYIIPDSVTTIENYAFFDCKGLGSIEIPDSVTTIGNYAFSGCTGLESIEIPNSVTTIGICLFDWCNRLTDVKFADIFAWYSTDNETYTDGYEIDVSDSSVNANKFKFNDGGWKDKYLYKNMN